MIYKDKPFSIKDLYIVLNLSKNYNCLFCNILKNNLK